MCIRDSIKLTSAAREAGGLAVFGTEHHESRRIDNQLRGRSGRQGDPGMSRFYISVEDELLQRFCNEKILAAFAKLPQDSCIEESRLFTRAITAAQKKVEGSNYDTRKQLIRYDDVLRKQRAEIYTLRDDILSHPEMRVKTKGAFETVVLNAAENVKEAAKKDKDGGIIEEFEKTYHLPGVWKEEKSNPAKIQKRGWMRYEKMTRDIEPNVFGIEKNLYLHILDDNWQNHIDAMSRLRTGFSLSSYAQNDPLMQYIQEAHGAFTEMKNEVDRQFVISLSNMKINYRAAAQS